MPQLNETESAVILTLEEQGPCTLEVLIQLLPAFTWNQIFMAVDRLSRQGRLAIHHDARFEYVVACNGPSR